MKEYICQYCGKKCKNLNSLRQHEIRCKENPNHIISCGNKGNMPKHIKSYYTKYVIALKRFAVKFFNFTATCFIYESFSIKNDHTKSKNLIKPCFGAGTSIGAPPVGV